MRTIKKNRKIRVSSLVMKALIHITFCGGMIFSALCKFHYPHMGDNFVFIIASYLASVLLIEFIMFYIGYGFAHKFLEHKNRFLYVGLVVLVYLFIWILTSVINGGIRSIASVQFLLSITSSTIDHFVWFIGGIILRYFFDARQGKTTVIKRSND